MRVWSRAGFAAVLGLLASGCGVSSWVTAPESEYPISMSQGIRDPDGELVAKSRKIVVGKYEQEYKACSMLWRMISFTGDKDISEEVNAQVKKAGGDAITEFSVESSGTVWNVVTFLGIFPDCANVKLRGNIVKVAAAPAPRATPAAPPKAAPATPAAPAAPQPPAAPPAPAEPAATSSARGAPAKVVAAR
jgi:hypothetical protein